MAPDNATAHLQIIAALPRATDTRTPRHPVGASTQGRRSEVDAPFSSFSHGFVYLLSSHRTRHTKTSAECLFCAASKTPTEWRLSLGTGWGALTGVGLTELEPF